MDISTLLAEQGEILILVLVFGAVLLAVIGLMGGRGRGNLGKRLSGRSAKDKSAVSEVEAEDSSLVRTETGAIGKMLQPVSKHLMPEDLTEISTLRSKLVRAGYLNPSAVSIFYASRLALAIGLPLVFIGVAYGVPLDLKLQTTLLIASVMGVVGLMGPTLFINQRIKDLERQYRESFPDALDLLVVCVEAGLGFDSAIERVRTELGDAHRALGDNFVMLSLELRAGRARQDALRNFADRIGIDEAKSLVTLILQSEELGTSIADALRVYSDEMRVKRMVVAETKAQALPVKLAVPLALFVFPVMLIIILLPIVIRVKTSLLN